MDEKIGMLWHQSGVSRKGEPFVQLILDGKTIALRKMIEADPQSWNVGQHFGGGMAIRNLLRDKGFGEKALGVDNLDDYYVGLMELAVMGQSYFPAVPFETGRAMQADPGPDRVLITISAWCFKRGLKRISWALCDLDIWIQRRRASIHD